MKDIYFYTRFMFASEIMQLWHMIKMSPKVSKNSLLHNHHIA